MRLRWAVALLLLLGLRYLHWRATDTLNLDTPLAATISVTTLVAEVLLLGSSFLELFLSLWLPPGAGRRQGRFLIPAARSRSGGGSGRDLSDPAACALRPDPPEAQEPWEPVASAPDPVQPSARAALPPWVDVLVPSYGEPPELIERCLRACLDLDYPRFSVWLLDDSGRTQLERLCAALGVRYLARQERSHAKAGNLNHALPHLGGELIAVFDADVLPLRSFLRRTVALFDEAGCGTGGERGAPVGFVQTPQTYRNADPVMRNLALERWLMPDEESFYRWIEPCREATGAVVCAGTSFVMRREALLRVGGFETGTPSEDLATGIRITAAGYRNRYLGEKLSSGLAPLSAAAMARQRCRWASGTLQTLRTGANPLTIPGLNPLQRLAYLEGIVHWLMPLPQLLLALMPLSLGVLGVAPLRLTGEGLLLFALPFSLAQLLLIRWLSAHSRTALLPELYRWIFLLPLAWAVLLTLLGRPQRFRVTPKALAGGRRTSPARRLLLPLLALFSLQLVSLLNLLRPAMGAALAPLSTTTLSVSLVWAALNLLLLSLALRACFDRPGLAALPWFRLDLPCRLLQGDREAAAELVAISEMGVELHLPGVWMPDLTPPGTTADPGERGILPPGPPGGSPPEASEPASLALGAGGPGEQAQAVSAAGPAACGPDADRIADGRTADGWTADGRIADGCTADPWIAAACTDECWPAEQRPAEQRPAEKWAAQQRAAEQWAPEHRIAEQLIVELLIVEQPIAEQGTAEPGTEAHSTSVQSPSAPPQAGQGKAAAWTPAQGTPGFPASAAGSPSGAGAPSVPGGGRDDLPRTGTGPQAITAEPSSRSRPQPRLDLHLEGLGCLPLRPMAREDRRLGAHWGPLDASQRQALFRFLHSRDGLWPQRKAPPEPLALLVVLQRWLLGCSPESWFRRSLMPQNPPPGEAG